MAVQLERVDAHLPTPESERVPNEKGPQADDPSKSLLSDISAVAEGQVGHVQNIDERIDKAGLADAHVQVSQLPDPLRPLVHPGEYVNWRELSKRAADTGWKRLDELLSASAAGDRSKDTELRALVSGDRNTANIVIDETSADRLAQTKSYLKDLGDTPKDLSVGELAALVTGGDLKEKLVVAAHAAEKEPPDSSIAQQSKMAEMLAARGNDPSRFKSGIGLVGSRQRAAAVGAAFSFILDQWRRDNPGEQPPVTGATPLQRATPQPGDNPDRMIDRVNESLRNAGMNLQLRARFVPNYDDTDPLTGRPVNGQAVQIEATTGQQGYVSIIDDGNRGMGWMSDRLYDFETQMRSPNGQIRWNEIFESGGGVWIRSSEGLEPSTHARPADINPSTGRPELVIIHYDGREGLPHITQNNQNPVRWADATNAPSHRILFHELGHAADWLTGEEPPTGPRATERVYTQPNLMTIPRVELPNIGLANYAGIPGNENSYAADFGLERRTFYADEEELDADGNINPFVDSDLTKRSIDHGEVGPVPDIDRGAGSAEDYKKRVESFANKYAGIYRQKNGQPPTLDNGDLATLYKEMVRYKMFHPEDAPKADLPSGGSPEEFMDHYVSYARKSVLDDLKRGFGNVKDKGREAGDNFANYTKTEHGTQRLDQLTNEAVEEFLGYLQPGGQNQGAMPKPKPPTMPFEPPIPAEPPPKPSLNGKDYVGLVNKIADNINRSVVLTGSPFEMFGGGAIFDRKKGFDNEETKQMFIDMASYRAGQPDTPKIKYDDELNAAAAALAEGISPGQGVRWGYEFDQEKVKPHLKNLFLKKLTEQNTPEPNLQKAHDAVMKDLRNRMINALKGDRDGKVKLQLYDRYVKDEYEGKYLSRFVSEEAHLVFTNDPYLYLNENQRGGDFPWRTVVQDIVNRVQKTGGNLSRSTFQAYLDKEGHRLARDWWLTTAERRPA